MPRKGTSLAYRIWFLPFYPPSIFARPEECPTIKSFAKKKGVDFTMMDKVDVNGVDAHPVYHYLKKVAGPVSINIYRVSHFNNGADYSLIAPRLDHDRQRSHTAKNHLEFRYVCKLVPVRSVNIIHTPSFANIISIRPFTCLCYITLH